MYVVSERGEEMGSLAVHLSPSVIARLRRNTYAFLDLDKMSDRFGEIFAHSFKIVVALLS